MMRRIRFAVVYAVATLATNCVNADTIGEFVKVGNWTSIKVHEVGDGMDANGMCLSGSVILAKSLRNASFANANLNNVRMQVCDLRNASFRGATLTGLTVSECDIRGADFTDAIINGIKSKDFLLSEEQLKSTKSYKTKNLRDCLIHDDATWNSSKKQFEDFATYDFTGVLLVGASLKGGTFEQSSFNGAMLYNARLGHRFPFERLAETEPFRSRTMPGMRFATLTGEVDFSGIDLSNCRFDYKLKPNYKFENTTISGYGTSLRSWFPGMTKSQLRTTRDFKIGMIRNVDFITSDFSGVDFSGMNLSGSKFIRCDLSDASFENAVVTDVEFDRTRVSKEQSESTWNHKFLNASNRLGR